MTYTPRMQPPAKRWCEVPNRDGEGYGEPDCGMRLRHGLCPVHDGRPRDLGAPPPDWY